MGSRCKSCGAPLVWVKMQSGWDMPCNPNLVQFWANPNAKGRVITTTGEVVPCDFEGPLEKMTNVGYIPHWATCPHADRHRRT